MNIAIVGDSWGWAWDDHNPYKSRSFANNMLSGCAVGEWEDSKFSAVPIQKMCLEQLGHTVLYDFSSPGADNRGAVQTVYNSLGGHEEYSVPDILVVNFTDPLRFGYRHADIDELQNHVHSLEAFHAFLNGRKQQDIQLYYELSRDYFNSCPVLFIGGHNKIYSSFVQKVNEKNNTDILHCVLESSTDYFSKEFCGKHTCDNVNENFSSLVNQDWDEEIIDYLLSWGYYTDENEGYANITWPDGGKHLNSSCQINVVDILMCYIEEHPHLKALL